MTSSPHGSYAWGDTHATMPPTARRDHASGSQSPNGGPVQIGGCNSEWSMLEVRGLTSFGRGQRPRAGAATGTKS